MTTKFSRYDIRRRHHGEMLEGATLKELMQDNVIEPILEWDGLVRPKYGQPFFIAKDGSSEQPLDEFGWVKDKDRASKDSFIIEVKAMRANDWSEWNIHKVWHQDKNVQHAKHIKNARTHGLSGVCVIAVNKDSSECLIRCFNQDDRIMEDFEYLY